MIACNHRPAAAIALIVVYLACWTHGPVLGQTSFRDDFERPNGPVDGWTSSEGTWRISGGSLAGTGVEPLGSWIWAGDPPFRAADGETEIRATVSFGNVPPNEVGRHGGLMLCASRTTERYDPEMGGYVVDWIDRGEDRGFRLVRYDPGSSRSIETILVSGTPQVADVPAEWRVQLDADAIRLLGDGELIFEVRDATYRGGHVGIWAYLNGTEIRVDDLDVTTSDLVLDACFEASRTWGAAPLQVDLDAACTKSAHGVVAYDWDFGDGDTASGPSVTHIFEFGGSYMVTLTVRDQMGNEDTDTVAVEVVETMGSYLDRFDRPDGPPDGWTIYRGNWGIEDGELVTRTSGDESWAWAGSPASMLPESFALRLECRFGQVPGDSIGRHAGVAFCATRATERSDSEVGCYTLDWIDRPMDHGLRLMRFDGGEEVPLAVGGVSLSDPPVAWEIVVDGDSIRLLGDGTEHLQVTDSTYRSGFVGLWAYENGQDVAFDDVEIVSAGVTACFTVGGDMPGVVGRSVELDARCSTAAIATISQYEWDFGDGSTGHGPTVSHLYEMPGTRTVRLTVRAVGGLSDTTERELEILPGGATFHRGDSNGDGVLTIVDPIFLLRFLFLGEQVPPCGDAADSNDDETLDITDPIRTLDFLFLGGEPPGPPGPASSPCGPDPAGEALDCASYEAC